MNPPLSIDEAARVARLHAYRILDTPAERAFDRLTRLVAGCFEMPMASISLIDADRQWLKSHVGMGPACACRREDAFCAHAILHDEVMVVRDATRDPRFADNPFVVGQPAIRFYAGAPLRTEDGFHLGTICVLDHVSRRFSTAHKRMLADFAGLVLDEMTLRLSADRLRVEAREHRRTQTVLRRKHTLLENLRGTLEERVRQRTADFQEANLALRAEIARREETDLALHAAKAEAEQANRAKSEFLSRMSHELRTPLNAILGFGQILRTQLASDTHLDCAEHIVAAGRHLLTLINEVLEIARIESGRLRLTLEPVGVGAVLAETLALVRPLAAARNIRLEEPLPGDLADLWVQADHGRFTQVLLNLLSNAVKHGPPDSRVVVACQPESSGHCRLSVRDCGPGLSSEEQDRLFVAFERLGSDGQGVHGSGLGLALSRHLVEAMHGDIGVRSQPGRGSEFWVRLPRAGSVGLPPAALPDPLPFRVLDDPPSGAPRSDAATCTVLYIEDNASNLRLVERLLARHPWLRLLSASSGETGLELARREPPDLVLLDLHLPGVSGLQVLAALRADETTRDIPVVALSADATRATIERVLDAGVAAYLVKPLNVEHLLHTLAVLHPAAVPAGSDPSPIAVLPQAC